MSVAMKTPCSFEFRSGSAKSVALAGNWNEWKPVPMDAVGGEDSGSWAISVDLVPGEVHFKFVVDGDWVTGSGYELSDDGHGGMNNMREVAPAIAKFVEQKQNEDEEEEEEEEEEDDDEDEDEEEEEEEGKVEKPSIEQKDEGCVIM